MMLVNNETGVRFPVEEVAAALKGKPTLLHTDAIQGFLKVPFTAASLGADLIALSGHKVGGPKGIGALYIGGKMKNPRPLLYGGGQEQNLRPGTEPTAQIAGFAAAVRRRKASMEADIAHMAACRDYALERTADIPGLIRIGEGTAPHILSLSLPGYPSQNIVSDLGEQGICISAGSACHKGKASHVLTAMGLSKKEAAGTIRVSFGPETTRENIDAFADALRAPPEKPLSHAVTNPPDIPLYIKESVFPMVIRSLRREPGFYHRLWRLSLPIILQNLITTSLGFADTFMVGLLGNAEMAAVTAANVPIFIIQVVIFGFQSGLAVLVSQYWGRGDIDNINRCIGVALYAVTGFATAIALITFFFPAQVLASSPPTRPSSTWRYPTSRSWAFPTSSTASAASTPGSSGVRSILPSACSSLPSPCASTPSSTMC